MASDRQKGEPGPQSLEELIGIGDAVRAEVVGAAPPNEPGQAAGGKGSGTAKGGANRTSRASTLPIRGGKREVKAYALTEDELTTLGAIQGLSALFFAFAGACLGFWLSVEQQLQFADKETPAQITAYWEGLQTSALVASGFCALLGATLFIFNGYRVFKIKRGTIH